jgi:acetyl/propionyl-CoA carboxylase alpha subunit
MPGLLSSVVVIQGQDVKAGEPHVIVEATKMENVPRVERDGRIDRIRAQFQRQPQRRPGYSRIRLRSAVLANQSAD